MPRQELIASQYFETQSLNSLLQFFYKENMAEYHSLGVLIIEWVPRLNKVCESSRILPVAA